jgi:GH24 family phage-related lysozyme (muramidase)
MKISEKGLALIKRFEGCSLKAYRDCAGVWTIGYGTTNADKALTGLTIKSGLKISQATAERWLRKSLDAKYGPRVAKFDPAYHWTQDEFDALVSFAYNIGSIDQLTANGKRSRAEIAAAWTLYCKADGRKVKGLLERREAELQLFRTLTPSVTGNPYPELTGTVTSTAQAAEKHLERWIPKGPQVKAMQWELCRLGYDLGTPAVDGVAGPKTVAAIEAFQRGAGLTVDGLCGPKTWAALKAAKEKPVGPIHESPAKVNYRAKVAAKAKEIYPLCIGKVHSGEHVGEVVSLETLKKYKALSCNRMVSIVLQEAGLLPKGCIVAHTAKRSGKRCIADAVTGYKHLRHCKLHWVNCLYKDLPEKWKKAGVVYFQNSNACISAGGGKIWSCNKSKNYHYKVKEDYLRTGGYPFGRILAVAEPEE